MPKQSAINAQLIVIGTGMAGMAASLFAARRGLDTIQVGLTSTIPFASGLLDLLGVHPVPEGRILDNPWEGIAQLRRKAPQHPYARMDSQAMRMAWEQMLHFLSDADQPYVAARDRNLRIVTPVGTIKTTYAVPYTMAAADRLLTERPPCLLVDFPGLKGFSARQIAQTLMARWPGLQTVRLSIPRLQGEVSAERLGRFLENGDRCRQLAADIRHHMAGVKAVGLPAVIGVHRTKANFERMQRILEVPLFEIPTMLPSLPGVRLRETFERGLPRLGVRAWHQQRVSEVATPDGRSFQLRIGGSGGDLRVRSKAVILASGRFFGKGLYADRTAIRESLFGLPVHQPATRDQWHRKDLFHPAGHAINRAGLRIDRYFRPVDAGQQPVYPRLFAAGSILAHQDWVREKCGSGLAITSAFAAVSACERLMD